MAINPFTGGGTLFTDKLLGQAYKIVEAVQEKLPEITAVSAKLDDITTVANTDLPTITAAAASAEADAATATTKATEAAASATAAAGSASAAEASQTAAASSETNAAASATSASTSAATASTKADEASASATAAATSESNAATSAGTATTKAAEASASATAAASSETSADTSATTATTKASEASASATSAQNWAMQADTPVDGTYYSARYYAIQAATFDPALYLAKAGGSMTGALTANNGFTAASPTFTGTTSLAAVSASGNLVVTGAAYLRHSVTEFGQTGVTSATLKIFGSAGFGDCFQVYRGGNISWKFDAGTADTFKLRVGAAGTVALTANATDVTTGGNLSVTGNLIVNGTTTTVNSTTVTIDDPVFTLGGDTAPTVNDTKDRGIEFRWHNGSTAKLGFFGFDDSLGKFTFIPDATNVSEVFSGAVGTIVADLEGAVAATTLSASGAVSGTGFTNLFASPPAIGGSVPAAGSFTTLATTGGVTLSGAAATDGGSTNSPVLTLRGYYDSDGSGGVLSSAASSTIQSLTSGGNAELVFSVANVGTLLEKLRLSPTTITVSGALSVTGNTTLGDASGDTVTINAGTVSIPNGLSVTNGAVNFGGSAGGTGQVNAISDGSVRNALQLVDSRAFSASPSAALVFRTATDATPNYTSMGYVLAGKANTTSGNLQGYLAFGVNNGVTQVEACRIDTSGNLLHGASADNFAIYGSKAMFRHDADATRFVTITNQTNGTLAYAGLNLSAYGNSWLVRTGGASANSNSLDFTLDATAPVIKARLRTDGFFNVSASMASFNPGSAANAVEGTALTPGYAWFTGANQTAVYAQRLSDGIIMGFYRSNSNCGNISVTTTTTTYGTSSDYRLPWKTGAIPLTNSGAFIDALKPMYFPLGEQAGFFAHEFQLVSPVSVVGEKDAVDAHGSPIYQSMQASSSEVMANIIAELQSLRARLATAGIA